LSRWKKCDDEYTVKTSALGIKAKRFSSRSAHDPTFNVFVCKCRMRVDANVNVCEVKY